MRSENGQWVITYNGEIYNHSELRRELGGRYNFRSESDTEVLLAALQTYGPVETLRKIRGMFAFGAWNASDKTLLLARDRIGEKPLYFGCQDSSLFFASELKAFFALPDFDGRVDMTAAADLLRFGYISEPRSIFENIWKLQPGSYLLLHTDNAPNHLSSNDISSRAKEYWDIESLATSNIKNSFADKQEATEYIGSVLESAISEQLVADVPVGAFLSGGIDSSLVCAIAAQCSNAPINTYSIGFSDARFDEAPNARAVASVIGSKHTEYYVSESDLMNVVPNLARIYDEPFADSSQIPSVLVSELARKTVTVCLSGDGGDELFGGYNRYRFTPKLYGQLVRMPNVCQRMLATLLQSRWLRNAGNSLSDKLSKTFHNTPNRLGDRLTKISLLASAESEIDAFNKLRMYWVDPCKAFTKDTCESASIESIDSLTFLQQALLIDQRSYLPGDNLAKVDRASMATSLEVRVPLLDFRLIEASWRCADEWKLNRHTTKVILRDLLSPLVSDELINRPKMGFSVPIAEWLRGDLKEWASDLLSPTAFNRSNVFDPEVVGKIWNAHQKSELDASTLLWPILMYQQWHAEYLS